MVSKLRQAPGKQPSSTMLVCYHFHPAIEIASRRMAALARALDSEGQNVLVVSSFGDSPVQPGSEILPGIRAFPVATPRRLVVGLLVRLKRLLTRGKVDDKDHARAVAQWSVQPKPGDGVMARIRLAFFDLIEVIDNYKKWGWLAYAAILNTASRQPVRLVIASGPPYSGVLAGWRAARTLGVPFVMDMRDPMGTRGPDNERHSALDAWLLNHLERRVVRDAAAVLCASPGILNAVRKRYPDRHDRIHLIMNGFDGDVSNRPRQTGRMLNILYAGSLYLNRDPFPFLQALERLLARKDVDATRVVVRFVGACESFGGVLLADWLEGKRSSEVVEILPPVDAKRLAPLMHEATVLLSLAQGQPRQIPAKTFEHLASGCEVLTLCEPDSDTGRLLDAISGTHRVTPGDAARLDAVLADLYERHAVEGELRPIPAEQVQRYSRRAQNARLLEILKSLPVEG